MAKKIAVLVGSLRKESFNRKIALALQSMMPDKLALSLVEIGNLPLFNQDLEGASPDTWVKFRQQITEADAVLFITPEYNRSVPAALKNAIDVGSRPYGKSVWSGKPAAVISSTIGATGAFGANHHLRQSLVFLDMPTLQQPEMYLGHIDKSFDEQGKLTNDSTAAFLKKFMETFTAWVEKTK